MVHDRRGAAHSMYRARHLFWGPCVAVLSLLWSGAVQADWSKVGPSDVRVHLGYSDDQELSREYWRTTYHDGGSRFDEEAVWLATMNVYANAGFRWTDDSGGWKRIGIRVSDILNYTSVSAFHITDHVDGPTLDTSIGTIRTIRFNADAPPPGGAYQCIGFTYGYDRGIGRDRDYYKRVLDFLACNGDRVAMTDEEFREIVGTLAVDHEFPSLF